ncbi:MAG: AraC family transcriptional regulator [Vallitalea sp.]|jgi:YesN/AraC family two-component response regulator|nr:AraC family transcriptional regulator [Vallitalea sp.]
MISYEEISIDELSPYIRKVGIEGNYEAEDKPRKIYDYEMLFCIEGNATIIIKHKKYYLKKGTLITIPPNEYHQFLFNRHNDYLIYWVHFDFKYRRDVYELEKLVTKHHDILYSEKLANNNYIRLPIKFEEGFSIPYQIIVEDIEIMSKYFKELYLTYSNHQMFWQIECKIKLLQILQLIFYQLNQDGEIKPYKNKKVSEVIINYIIKNYNRKLTMKELASVINLSEDYLGKVFKKETGYTIIDFINRFRIKKAKELLVDESISIETISEIIGYSDVYYFSRIMKKYEGIAPSYWRKKEKMNKYNIKPFIEE